LNVCRVRGEGDELDVLTDRLAGAGADQPVGAGQLQRQEVADLEVDDGLETGLADRADDGVVVADVPSMTLS
jgi:hypothetical protein